MARNIDAWGTQAVRRTLPFKLLTTGLPCNVLKWHYYSRVWVQVFLIGSFHSQLDQHIEDVCPKTKMVCEFEVIGCTHRVSFSNLVAFTNLQSFCWDVENAVLVAVRLVRFHQVNCVETLLINLSSTIVIGNYDVLNRLSVSTGSKQKLIF